MRGDVKGAALMRFQFSARLVAGVLERLRLVLARGPGFEKASRSTGQPSRDPHGGDADRKDPGPNAVLVQSV
jgi:hypothetical protein